jgi:hypothetical protein
MKKKMIIALILGLMLTTGCETTMGSKRSNGSATEHTTAKLKNVTVSGNLTIGGSKQKSDRASQEGLGRVQADAAIKDTLNGNKLDGGALKDLVAPVPAVPEVIIPKEGSDLTLSGNRDVPVPSAGE